MISKKVIIQPDNSEKIEIKKINSEQNDFFYDDLIYKMIQVRTQYISDPFLSYQSLFLLKTIIRSLSASNYKSLKQHSKYQESWAYICFISDLQKYPLDPNLSQKLYKKPLYFLGDSHILSFAHRQINGQLVVPILCVGLKAWHFQEKFKEGKQIQKLERKLAELSEKGVEKVIISAGEIDCRIDEGIILALQKGYYSDLYSAVQATVSTFLTSLKLYQSKYSLKLKLLPPFPCSGKKQPLRSQTIQLFNQLVREAEEKNGGIQVVTVFEELVCKKCNKKDQEFQYGMLKSEYRLDGTHVNPRVIEILEKFNL